MEFITGKPEAMKKINSDLIKEALKKIGPSTKSELVKVTGISCTTIRSLLVELIDEKEIVSAGIGESSGGRPAERYMLNLEEHLALVILICNKHLIYAITNSLGDMLENGQSEITNEDCNNDVYDFIDSMLKNNKYIKTIGIGGPGIADDKGYFIGKEVNQLKQFNIGEYIGKKYKIPVVLENNLNAIALGYSLNLMKKFHVDDLDILNMVYIHFTKEGTGSGIIANGKLVRGSYNFAGEIGFIPIEQGKTLNQIVYSNPDDELYIDVIARVISIFNCVINPDFLVVGGSEFRFCLIDKIKERSKKYIEKDVMPDIFSMEDSKNDYLTGMTYLALEQVKSGIKLINSTRKY